jgi:hypothetical protein
MFPTLIAKTRMPGPPATNEDTSAGRPPRRHDPEDRLHVSALVAGLIDARACHIDFLDTPGGQEVERWYRRHRTARRHHRLTPGR